MTKVYFKLVFQKPLFYLSILLVTVSVMCRYLYLHDSSDVVNAVDVMLDLDGMRKIILIFAAIPFNSQFCTEWMSNTKLYVIIRKNIKSYVGSHIIVSVITSFLVTLIGLLLFAVITRFHLPWYIQYENDSYNFAFGYFLENGSPLCYIVIKLILYSLSNSIWCTLGLLGSVFLTSPYVAICSPFIFSYIIEKLILEFPIYVNLYLISLGRLQFNGHNSNIIDFLYSIVFQFILIGIIGLCFYKFTRRKIENANY